MGYSRHGPRVHEQLCVGIGPDCANGYLKSFNLHTRQYTALGGCCQGESGKISVNGVMGGRKWGKIGDAVTPIGRTDYPKATTGMPAARHSPATESTTRALAFTVTHAEGENGIRRCLGGFEGLRMDVVMEVGGCKRRKPFTQKDLVRSAVCSQ